MGGAPRRRKPLESAAELLVDPVEKVPRIPPRLLGWSKLLYDKGLVDDAWSRSGACDPRWDSYSTAPLTPWPRFHLTDAANVRTAIEEAAEIEAAWLELSTRSDLEGELCPLLEAALRNEG